MWFATVVGLCLGGGQLILGSVSTAIGFAVLWGLRHVEAHVERYQIATLKIVTEGDELQPEEMTGRIKAAAFQVKSLSMTNRLVQHQREFDWEIRWPAPRGDAEVPSILAELEDVAGVVELEWKATHSGPRG
jgi:putative Mg2+ transporter-C (MgtC) family protein